MGQRALNQAANIAINARLARYGMVAKHTTIYRSTIGGATVTALVEYGPHGGPVTNRAELTIILHRTVWSLGQITLGLVEHDRN